MTLLRAPFTHKTEEHRLRSISVESGKSTESKGGGKKCGPKGNPNSARNSKKTTQNTLEREVLEAANHAIPGGVSDNLFRFYIHRLTDVIKDCQAVIGFSGSTS